MIAYISQEFSLTAKNAATLLVGTQPFLPFLFQGQQVFLGQPAVALCRERGNP